jgi:Uma2 family endonuclease
MSMNAPDVEAAFQAAPSERVAEILDGDLHTSPRPHLRHARAASRLGGALDPFDRDVGGPGGWVILDEPELHLSPRPDKIVPDLAGWRRARMPELPDDAAVRLAPDWVCEVLSEHTEAVDRGAKLRIYRREKVGHAWLVSPALRTLEVYRLQAGNWVLVETFEGNARIRAESFDAIELDLGTLWAR